MLREKAYIVGIGFGVFRTNTPAEIIGVEIVKPDSNNGELLFRPCYHVEWSDGVRDHIPISSVESGNHKIIPFADVINKSWEKEEEDKNKWVKLVCEKCGQVYRVRKRNRTEKCLNVISIHPEVNICDGKLIEYGE